MRSLATLLATVFATGAALAPATGASAQDMVIVNATLVTGDGSAPIEQGAVIIDDGKVVYAGPQSGAGSFSTDQVIDVNGQWVTPGLFSALTDLGLVDVSGVSDSNDVRAGRARFNAAMDVVPALNPSSQHIAVSREGGVTRASVTAAPAGAIFAGQGAIVDLGADPDMLVRPRAFQLAMMGEGGAQLAGGSRIAAHAELRNALREAEDFAAGRWSGEDNLLTRADAAALVPVLRGEQRFHVVAERAADIRSVIALKREFPKLDLVLVGASEGWLVAGDIARAGVPVLADALDDLPSSFEQLAATQSNVGRMVRAGVKVGLGGFMGMTQPRYAPQYAGNLVALQKVPGATGLSWGEAFAAISSIPAEISGHGGQFGVLKRGAAGDVVIWDGDPLEVSSAPVQVFIDGIAQPLDNHQSRLRQRYRDLDESDRPKAYDW